MNCQEFDDDVRTIINTVRDEFFCVFKQVSSKIWRFQVAILIFCQSKTIILLAADTNPEFFF